jgi:hypothetical protein
MFSPRVSCVNAATSAKRDVLVNSAAQGSPPPLDVEHTERGPARAQGRTIPVTCQTHGGSRGFCNLRVRRQGGDIVLDPHVTGACVIVLDEAAATELFDLLGEWLG